MFPLDSPNIFKQRITETHRTPNSSRYFFLKRKKMFRYPSTCILMKNSMFRIGIKNAKPNENFLNI